jgi:hypothetical protein
MIFSHLFQIDKEFPVVLFLVVSIRKCRSFYVREGISNFKNLLNFTVMKNVLLFILPVLLLGSACRYVSGERIRGNGNLKTEERSVGSFKSVSSHGSFNVYVSSGDQSLKIEA